MWFYFFLPIGQVQPFVADWIDAHDRVRIDCVLSRFDFGIKRGYLKKEARGLERLRSPTILWSLCIYFLKISRCLLVGSSSRQLPRMLLAVSQMSEEFLANLVCAEVHLALVVNQSLY